MKLTIEFLILLLAI